MTENLDSRSGKPLQLLDLPLEIQQTIFEKCFEEPWTVTMTRSDDWPFEKPGVSSPTAFALLLVNRHVHREAKRAIELSGSGIYKTNLRFLSDEPKPYDKAITTYKTTQWETIQETSFKPRSTKFLTDRFPNLQTVRSDSIGSMMWETKDSIRGKSLHDTLQGSFDKVLLACAKADYDALYDEGIMKDLSVSDIPSITVSWSIKLNAHEMVVPEGIKAKFSAMTLVIDFEADEHGIRVTRKWLKDDRTGDVVTDSWETIVNAAWLELSYNDEGYGCMDAWDQMTGAWDTLANAAWLELLPYNDE